MNFSQDEIARLRLVLKKISFLEHLKLSELDELIKALDRRPFHRGEMIIRQGEPGETFYILSSGSVGVYKKKGLLSGTKRVATLTSEGFFGEMALIDNSVRTATVSGEEDGELYYLPRDSFKKVLLNNPGIAALIRQTADYRRAQNRTLENS